MREISTKECIIRFGKFIKQTRLEKNITQEELAERAGISRPYLSRLERGERIVDLPLALQLCDALEVNFQKFILLYMKDNPFS